MPVTSGIQRWPPVRVVICDLDGVVWLSGEAIPGSPEAIDRLRNAGVRVMFATNNSAPLVAAHEEALAGLGIVAVGDVVTSAQAVARLCAAGETVAVVGGGGLNEALADADVRVVDLHRAATDGRTVDAVVVGLDRSFTYATLSDAAHLVRRGARLLASNDDATYPTPGGLIPGGGAMLAAVVTASGHQPLIAGKPHSPMAELVLARCPGVDPRAMIMVGDRPDTDGKFARQLGCRYAQVRTGVVAPGVPVADADIDVADLSAVADYVLGERLA